MCKHFEDKSMNVNIDKWGNSLGIKIPSHIAKQAKLKKGSQVNIEFKNGMIVINTSDTNLETLLSKVTPQNKHDDPFDDPLQGGETW